MDPASNHLRGVYAIVDLPDPYGHDPAEQTAALIRGGARCVQLRAKGGSAPHRMELALTVAPVAHAQGVPLIVNDDVELALAGLRGVSGVHLGQEDLGVLGRHGRADGHDLRELIEVFHARGLWVGVSTHDLEQVRVANRAGADYIGFGPVFPTRSKKDPDPVVGLDGVAQASQLSHIPVVAIGGIDAAGARACARAGASAVALISGLRGPTLEDVEAATTKFARHFVGSTR